jgi:pSer/pThr/pTyr-binding forkhead associated (FHA) protein
MPTLVISHQDGRIVNYPIDPEITTIGRHSDSLVPLTSVMASGQHAIIRQREDGHFYVQDLGSSNGTHVNGVAVEEAVLANGDQLAFGDEAAAFYLADEVAAEAPKVEVRQSSYACRLRRQHQGLGRRGLAATSKSTMAQAALASSWSV